MLRKLGSAAIHATASTISDVDKSRMGSLHVDDDNLVLGWRSMQVDYVRWQHRDQLLALLDAPTRKEVNRGDRLRFSSWR